jgi:hypothetical protein
MGGGVRQYGGSPGSGSCSCKGHFVACLLDFKFEFLGLRLEIGGYIGLRIKDGGWGRWFFRKTVQSYNIFRHFANFDPRGVQKSVKTSKARGWGSPLRGHLSPADKDFQVEPFCNIVTL